MSKRIPATHYVRASTVRTTGSTACGAALALTAQGQPSRHTTLRWSYLRQQVSCQRCLTCLEKRS